MNTAHILNQNCQCVTLNPARLREELARDDSLQAFADKPTQTHPHLFASGVVFIAHATYKAMAQAIAAIERVMAQPAYVAHALRKAPALSQQRFGPHGVFMGYDFHVDASANEAAELCAQPRLIEINTNAGGALLSVALARSQQTCCTAMTDGLNLASPLAALEQTWFEMFQSEWQTQRSDMPLRRIAIVDDRPSDQYLAPEFAMFRALFESRGVRADVADASALVWRDGQLWLNDDDPSAQAAPIDLVYNRLTDFDLSEPAHQALRQAYAAGAVVVTPHPHAHALRANKRHLAVLSSDALLSQWGISDADRQTLRATVPNTVLCAEHVAAATQATLWANRRKLFFKPVSGYGGKAAYRGDKLTQRAWQDVLAGDFVAQDFAAPGQRLFEVDGTPTAFKFDIRAYTYQGQIQFMTARIYSGQTTNFRTPGGGFSPVLVLPSGAG
jgi:hypothetical protein